MQDTGIAMRLQRWTAIISVALFAATYRLWIPQSVFPQVPAFVLLCDAPVWCDWILFGCLIAGLFFVAMGRTGYLHICGCVLILVSLFALVCLDQHRLQPWAYQLWLFTTIWLCCGFHVGLTWMRWLMVSIYFYSAVGKFDFEFLHTVGQQMLGAMAKWFGRDLTEIPGWLRLGMVAAFPLAELVVAAGLVWPKTRRLAGVLAICLHMTLIGVLGPFGLNHRIGVLLWNAQFAVQVYLLFVAKRVPLVNSETVKQPVAPKWCVWLSGCMQSSCIAMIATVIVLPITERFGIWDHWPSWALYAPHSSRVRVEVAASSLDRLPAELVALMKKPTLEDEETLEWVLVPIDAWSLQSLDTPIYPQARFQLGVAKKIASAVDSEGNVRVTVLGSANRFTGRRQTEVFDGASQLKKAGANLWFNSLPRRQQRSNDSIAAGGRIQRPNHCNYVSPTIFLPEECIAATSPFCFASPFIKGH